MPPVDATIVPDVDSDEPCCVCFELVDEFVSPMMRCSDCGLHIHTKCHGSMVPDAEVEAPEDWVCEPCAYQAGHMQSGDSSFDVLPPNKRPRPSCALCPVEGGALRLTDQPNVWAHILCVNWLPELANLIYEDPDDRVRIGELDPGRLQLSCRVCSQRGPIIQCRTGRCSFPFHPMCGIRAPSSYVFTGYTPENQQTYHCSAHLKDMRTYGSELLDDRWLKSPRVDETIESHPKKKGFCPFCYRKLSSVNRMNPKRKASNQYIKRKDMEQEMKEAETLESVSYTLEDLSEHELVCLQSKLVQRDLEDRKQRFTAFGVEPPRIQFHTNKGTESEDGRRAKGKRKHASVKPCPNCGESIRESMMARHLKDQCPERKTTHGKSQGGSKKASKSKMKRRTSGVKQAAEDVEDVTPTADSIDVLFASWPNQHAGARMSTTHFWRVVNANCFSMKPLTKRRTDQLLKAACGARLEDLISVSDKASSVGKQSCTDSYVLYRKDDGSQGLALQTVLHACETAMRQSKTKCSTDVKAELKLEIDRAVANGTAKTKSAGNATQLRVLFMNESSQTSIQVVFSFAMSSDVPSTSAKELEWSPFVPNQVGELVGAELEKVELPSDTQHLYTAIESSEATSADVVKDPKLCTEELTPQINLLLDQYQEQMRRNRVNVRQLAHALEGDTQRHTAMQKASHHFEAYYRDYEAWKRLSHSLVTGYRHFQQPMLQAEPQEEVTDEMVDEHLDDGTCVVCFDGQSPEHNPIVFCDKCNLAVHQRCYGLPQVPANEFFCDRCRSHGDGMDPARDVFCQLCPIKDGAFKKTMDGKWIHVVCALWCPKVWIGDLHQLTSISLCQTSGQMRFLDPIKEAEKLAAQETLESEHVETRVLEQGGLCRYCRVACGRTIQCCADDCSVSYHALCAWFAGLSMTASNELPPSRRFIYAGGGAGLSFQLLCDSHFPEEYTSDVQDQQIRRRRRVRIDAYSSIVHDESVESPRKLQSAGGSSASTLLSEENVTSKDTIRADDRQLCSACFEYMSPPGESGWKDAADLTKRQLQVRCQYCNCFVHPECCISDLGDVSDVAQSNWICERCVAAGSRRQLQSCIVCEKEVGYLMSCSVQDKSSGSQQKATFDKWIHVLCCKYVKGKMTRRKNVLSAIVPSDMNDADASRQKCDLCGDKSKYLASCDGCTTRFHAICAAHEQFFIARSTRNNWRFFCKQHPPRDAVYDHKRLTWFTRETLTHLQDLRRSLERGRMLLEMARQRDRHLKRMFTFQEIPLYEMSTEVVLKKRPLPNAKKVYQSLTGEQMIDIRNRNKRPIKKNAAKGPPLKRVKKEEDVDRKPPSRAAKRQATMLMMEEAPKTKSVKESSLWVVEDEEHPEGVRRSSRLASTDETEMEDGEEGLKERFIGYLEKLPVDESFDDVIPKVFPELVDE